MSVLTTPAALEALRSDWDALLTRSGADGPMLSPTWLLPWWRVFGSLDGRRLVVIAIRRGGRLIGLAPLAARTHWYRPGIPFRRLEMLGTGEPQSDEVCSEYMEIIAERGAEEDVARGLAEALAGGAAGAWDELTVGPMDRRSRVRELLAAELARLGAGSELVSAGPSFQIVLPSTYAEYLACVSPSSRYLLTRSVREFEKWAGDGAALHVATSRVELDEGKRALIGLHGERWGNGGAFASERFNAFHDEVMPALLARGALDLLWITVRGEPVAATYLIVWRGSSLYYQSGRKLDVPRNIRLGIVLHAYAVERSIELGRREYDFLAGDYRYKRELATATRDLVHLRAVRSNSRLRERARVFAEGGIATGRAVLAGLRRDEPAPPSPSKSVGDADALAVLHGDLNMLRCFAGTGVRTVVLSPDPDALSFFSKHCGQRRVIADVGSEPARALGELIDLGKLLPGRPVLFYGDDAMLLLVSRHRAELASSFRFALPAADLVEALVDKLRFASLARDLALPTPRTLVSSETRRADEIARVLPPPWILKPFCHLGWRTSPAVVSLGVGPVKALYAGTTSDLARMIDRIESFSRDFVIQEFIPGGEEQVYSFHAYLDGARRSLGHYVGRKIRTYPRSAGVSTYLELVDEPELVRVGFDVIDRLGLVGVVKLDFKRHPRTGAFHLLEVNPRYSLWNHLGAASGVNLPHLAYLDLTGKAPAPAPAAKTGVRWLSLADDARTFVRDYAPAGELSLAGWLDSLRGRKVYDVFAWDDASPFVLDVARALRKRSAAPAPDAPALSEFAPHSRGARAPRGARP